MVAMDSSVHSGTQPLFKIKLPLAGFVGGAAACLTLGVMARFGFSDQGLRLGSEFAWRFASIVFFAAASIGPVCRLLPLGALKLAGLRRQAIWSFCASYGVFLAAMLLPNTLGGVTHDDESLGMILFSLFGGGAALVLAWSASQAAVERLGEKARRALLSVAASFFWLTYALTGLAHISGPHRPDAYYGLSLSLMILALLFRFADRLAASFRGTPAPTLSP